MLWRLPSFSFQEKPPAVKKKEGFIELRQLVPNYLVQPAYDDAVKHFTSVTGAFTDGYAIDQIDHVHTLPGKL